MKSQAQQVPEAEKSSAPPTLIEAGVITSLAAAVLSLFLFAWIADQVAHGATVRFDLGIRSWVHQFASPGMTRAMTAISLLGHAILLAELAIALVVFLYVGWKHAAAWLAASMAGALVLEYTLKHTFHRPRPPVFFGAEPSSYSFPSGHALSSFCFYVVLAGLIADRTRSTALRITLAVVAAVLVVAIGLSRIYLGMHYPSDVLAGYLAAAIWVTTLLALDRWRIHRNKRAAALRR